MAEDIRVGVFVCDCGSNIAGVVDVPKVVEYAKQQSITLIGWLLPHAPRERMSRCLKKQ